MYTDELISDAQQLESGFGGSETVVSHLNIVTLVLTKFW